MSSKKLKPLPEFATDKEAERFVDEADLTEFDLSGAKSFAFKRAASVQPVSSRTATHVFELYKDRNDKIRFRFRASSGEVIFTSDGYPNKASALDVIAAIKAFAAGAETVVHDLAA